MAKHSYPHPTPWKGNDLRGVYLMTIKIDGVRMLRDDEGNPVSRNGKPLYNLEDVPEWITDAEIYYGNWEDSIHHVRSSKSEVGKVDIEHVYPLFPEADARLRLGYFVDPTAEQINAALEEVVAAGYEGMVLREMDGKGKLFKVKPKETYDVSVTGMIEGTGKHKGRMGALLTSKGKVGTGFTDEERERWWEFFMGCPCTIIDDISETPTQYLLLAHAPTPTIEVECWELTKGGKFRHPRYIRTRVDK